MRDGWTVPAILRRQRSRFTTPPDTLDNIAID